MSLAHPWSCVYPEVPIPPRDCPFVLVYQLTPPVLASLLAIGGQLGQVPTCPTVLHHLRDPTIPWDSHSPLGGG